MRHAQPPGMVLEEIPEAAQLVAGADARGQGQPGSGIGSDLMGEVIHRRAS